MVTDTEFSEYTKYNELYTIKRVNSVLCGWNIRKADNLFWNLRLKVNSEQWKYLQDHSVSKDILNRKQNTKYRSFTNGTYQKRLFIKRLELGPRLEGGICFIYIQRKFVQNISRTINW